MKRAHANTAPSEPRKVAKKQSQAADKSSEQVTIAVENYMPENVPVHYSDGLTVVHSANEFIISFLLTEYPLAGSKDELQQVKSVRRKCITQIIVSPAQFEAIAKVFQHHLQKYVESYRKPSEG